MLGVNWLICTTSSPTRDPKSACYTRRGSSRIISPFGANFRFRMTVITGCLRGSLIAVLLVAELSAALAASRTLDRIRSSGAISSPIVTAQHRSRSRIATEKCAATRSSYASALPMPSAKP